MHTRLSFCFHPKHCWNTNVFVAGGTMEKQIQNGSLGTLVPVLWEHFEEDGQCHTSESGIIINLYNVMDMLPS